MIFPERNEKIDLFLKNHSFSLENADLFHLAFTHGSYHQNDNMQNNQRLEFLGDSVLSLCLSEYLFQRFPDYPEGKLTKIRSYLVSEKYLASLARKIGIDEMLYVGKGEESSGGRKKDAILADAFEAFLAALYLTHGIETVRNFLLNLLQDEIERVSQEDFISDYKTELQYIIQKKYKICPQYRVVLEEGPAHNKKFTSELYIQNKVMSKGTGNTKKKAEQEAARILLDKIRRKEIQI